MAHNPKVAKVLDLVLGGIPSKYEAPYGLRTTFQGVSQWTFPLWTLSSGKKVARLLNVRSVYSVHIFQSSKLLNLSIEHMFRRPIAKTNCNWTFWQLGMRKVPYTLNVFGSFSLEVSFKVEKLMSSIPYRLPSYMKVMHVLWFWSWTFSETVEKIARTLMVNPPHIVLV